MTPQHTLFKTDFERTQDTETAVFAFYLVPDFAMLAVSSAIEALRFANRVLGYEAYNWRLVSESGGAVRASCGIALEADHSLATERKVLLGNERPSMAIVCAEGNVESRSTRPLEAWLRECRHRRIPVGALGTGTYILAKAGLLEQRRCAIHWEKLPSFAEEFSGTLSSASIYETDCEIWTCAGGSASFDMMLRLIERDFGEQTTAGICEHALVERPRRPTERQRLPLAARAGMSNEILIKIVEQMERHIAEPLPLDVIAARVDRSRRQIERLFRHEFNFSPVRYYRDLRLERAKLLLRESYMPVVEVAIACGFVSASHFSKVYRDAFGVSPQQSRKSGPPRGKRGECSKLYPLASVSQYGHRNSQPR